MAEKKTIKLDCYGIVIILTGPEPIPIGGLWRWGSGTITSDMKEVCKYCQDPDCLMDCPEYKEYASDRDTDIVAERLEERAEFQRHRGMIDVLEALTLHHAVAGIDIESPAYIEGVETVLDAITNNT